MNIKNLKKIIKDYDDEKEICFLDSYGNKHGIDFIETVKDNIFLMKQNQIEYNLDNNDLDDINNDFEGFEEYEDYDPDE